MDNLQFHITVECRLEIAWKLWTTTEGLSSFFGQDNKFELKLEGPFEIYFSLDAPVGSRGSESCKVLSFIENRMLSFSWNAPPSIPLARASSHRTFVVIFFEANGVNKCKISLFHEGWTEEGSEWIACKEYFKQAWPFVLKNFKARAEKEMISK